MTTPDHTGSPAPPILDGIRVVEFSQLIASSLCGLTLSDLGADVIKVEGRHGDYTRTWAHEGQPSGVFHMLNRDKRGVSIDLGSAEGRETARALVATADVVVENLGDPAAVLGFDHDDASRRQPGLVWCSITGFGVGRSERAIDQTLQASMGMIALTGEPDGPPLRVPLPVVDIVTGMYAVQSILAGLLQRERTGRGTHLDCAMIDASATLTCSPAALWLTGYHTPRRTGSESDLFVPSAVFGTADGRYVQVVAIGEAHWRAICRAVGRDDWLTDERFATGPARLAHRHLVHDELAVALREHPAEHWTTEIRRRGGFCERIRDIEEVWSDPVLEERGLVTDLPLGAGRRIRVPTASLVPGRPPDRHRCAPGLGQDNPDVLGPLGRHPGSRHSPVS